LHDSVFVSLLFCINLSSGNKFNLSLKLSSIFTPAQLTAHLCLTLIFQSAC
jgi:hypothetical protein